MMELESMAVEMPVVEGHPNRAGFRGVLTVVDVVSQRAPSGSKGHRVVLTRAAAEAALPSLLGMAVDYAPTFDRHDQRRKVGVITSAEIVGRDLEVGGYLYAKDFLEVVEEVGRSGRRASDVGVRASGVGLRVSGAACRGDFGTVEIPTLRQAQGRLSRAKDAREMGHPHLEFPGLAKTARPGASPRWNEGNSARWELAAAVERLRELVVGRRVAPLQRASDVDAGAASGLGMSFEVSDVVLADRRARVWILTHVTFTGAAILKRDRAAYEDTWIALES